MAEPETTYLGPSDAIRLYAEIYSCPLSVAEGQLRDSDGLAGALGRPEMHAHYAGADIAQQAAALTHGIAEGQFFVDGNKRLALAMLLTFLQANGYDVIASQIERAHWIVALSGGLGVDWLAEQIRASLDPELPPGVAANPRGGIC